jgi:hypothetical protein
MMPQKKLNKIRCTIFLHQPGHFLDENLFDYAIFTGLGNS